MHVKKVGRTSKFLAFTVLMKLKNNYLFFKNLMKWANKKCKNWACKLGMFIKKGKFFKVL